MIAELTLIVCLAGRGCAEAPPHDFPSMRACERAVEREAAVPSPPRVTRLATCSAAPGEGT